METVRWDTVSSKEMANTTIDEFNLVALNATEGKTNAP